MEHSRVNYVSYRAQCVSSQIINVSVTTIRIFSNVCIPAINVLVQSAHSNIEIYNYSILIASSCLRKADEKWLLYNIVLPETLAWRLCRFNCTQTTPER